MLFLRYLSLALSLGYRCLVLLAKESSLPPCWRFICDRNSQMGGTCADRPGKLHRKGKAKQLFFQMQTSVSARSDYWLFLEQQLKLF